MTAVCWRCNGAGYVRRHSTNALLFDDCDVCDGIPDADPTDPREVDPDIYDTLAQGQE